VGEKLWAKKCEEESGDQAVVSQKPKSPSQRRHEEGMAVMQGTCVCSALVCAFGIPLEIKGSREREPGSC